MNNRTRIKKKSKYNINLFLVKLVHCKLKWCCKKQMCTVVQKLCKDAFRRVRWLLSNLIFTQANEIV